MEETLPDIARRESIWEGETTYAPADVAIVGGGIVGLQTAIQLKRLSPKLDTVILERSDPPAGASTRNAGFACIGSLGELVDDVAAIGFDATVDLVLRRYRGLELLRETVPEQSLDYASTGNIEWFGLGEREAFDEARALLVSMNAALSERHRSLRDVYTVSGAFASTTGLSAVGAILNRAEGQLHPGKMVAQLIALARSLGVRTLLAEVNSVEGGGGGYGLALHGGRHIQARRVVIATNAFARQLVPVEVAPVLNQVIVSTPVEGLTWTMPMHVERGYGYLRRIGDRVLVGGFRNGFAEELSASVVETRSFRLEATIGAHLRRWLRQVLPKGYSLSDTRGTLPNSSGDKIVGIEYEWSGVLGIGATRDPRVSVTANDIVIAAGLGGMGVALGSLLGLEAAQTVLARG